MSSSCNHPCCGEVCRREPKPKKARIPLKRGKPLRRYNAKPKVKSDEEKAFAEELKVFFDAMMIVNEPLCENCGSFRPYLKEPYYKFLWKSCQAHLLPKRHFESIATNPLNIMVLGSGVSQLCNCHDNYDHSWDKASNMTIWNEVVRRFKILYPLIASNEHQFIPDILLIELNK